MFSSPMVFPSYGPVLSPLSPAAQNTFANTPFGLPLASMAQPSRTQKPTPFSRRSIKGNPLVQSRDSAKNKRRDIFFRKIQQGRDDRNWEARGEQIMRLDFVSEKKKWEAQQARSAPKDEDHIPDVEIDDAYDSQEQPSSQGVPSSQMAIDDAEEVDVLAQQEEEELDALIGMMEEESVGVHEEPQTYGSDDEDYDALFSDILAQESSQPGVRLQHQVDLVEDEMDTSNG